MKKLVVGHRHLFLSSKPETSRKHPPCRELVLGPYGRSSRITKNAGGSHSFRLCFREVVISLLDMIKDFGLSDSFVLCSTKVPGSEQFLMEHRAVSHSQT